MVKWPHTTHTHKIEEIKCTIGSWIVCTFKMWDMERKCNFSHLLQLLLAIISHNIKHIKITIIAILYWGVISSI